MTKYVFDADNFGALNKRKSELCTKHYFIFPPNILSLYSRPSLSGRHIVLINNRHVVFIIRLDSFIQHIMYLTLQRFQKSQLCKMLGSSFFEYLTVTIIGFETVEKHSWAQELVILSFSDHTQYKMAFT